MCGSALVIADHVVHMVPDFHAASAEPQRLRYAALTDVALIASDARRLRELSVSANQETLAD